MLKKIKSIFSKNPKPKLHLVPGYKTKVLTTYQADINIIFNDDSVIIKKYIKTISDQNDTDCPILKYIENIYKQGYLTITVKANIKTFNTINIKEITYNPQISQETIKEEFPC